MANIFKTLLGIWDAVNDKFGVVIDLLKKLDLTKLNDDDRAHFRAAAKEWRESGQAQIKMGDILEQVANGNLTGEDYEQVIVQAKAVAKEAADIGPATKALF